jgi:hypothetical protein
MSAYHVIRGAKARSAAKGIVTAAASFTLVLAGLVVSSDAASASEIPATMILSATPWVSVGAGEYANVMTASMSLPVGNVAPAGNVYFGSEFGEYVNCQTSSWSLTTNGGIDTYAASCAQQGSSAFVGVDVAEYEGSDDYAVGNEIISLNVVTDGFELGGASGNEYDALLAEPVSAVAPSGMLTFSDGIGGTCSSTSWVAESIGNSTVAYLATCDITSLEPLGTVVSGTYTGSDFTFGPSNPLTLVGLSLSGSPENSATGNTYTGTLDSRLGPAPLGDLYVPDSNGGSCSTGTWTDAGSDLSGGELYTATCSIADAEPAGTTVTAEYSEGFDMLAPTTNEITVLGAPAGPLQLSGTPVASVSGNSYTVSLDAPTDLTPTGSASVTDDAATPGTCSASSWTALQPDGTGGEDFSATCSISTPETAGETVQASYAGSDYTSAPSNVLTVAAVHRSTIGTPTTPLSQIPLNITTTSGRAGRSLVLLTSGGSGTGSVSYVALDGSAAGCALSGDALSAHSAGTCFVTATKASDATYTSVSSPATVISMALPARPAMVTVRFTLTSASLNAHVRSALLGLSRQLVSGASVTVTGYAKGNLRLARARAESAARYIERRTTIHVTLRTSTASSKHEVTIVTITQ